MKLPKKFYMQDCLNAAKALIGKILVRIYGNEIYSGIIVETEAYLGDKDKASHSYNGKTKRNECMFSEGGIAYVYFTYGNHYCFNVVTGPEGMAHAVLVRAVIPATGMEYMKKNRHTDNVYNLTSGPGKLAQAFRIDKSLNGADLRGDEIYILSSELQDFKITASKRIGITKDAEKPYRFYAEECLFVSGRKNTNK